MAHSAPCSPGLCHEAPPAPGTRSPLAPPVQTPAKVAWLWRARQSWRRWALSAGRLYGLFFPHRKCLNKYLNFPADLSPSAGGTAGFLLGCP